MEIEFDARNEVVKLCLKGMALEISNNMEEASEVFYKALDISKNDFEKYLSSYYIARSKTNIEDKIIWYEKTIKLAQMIDDIAVTSALPKLYIEISDCYKELSSKCDLIPTDKGPFYHGTKADLNIGDLLTPGGLSNYKDDFKMNHIYFTSLINGAGLAAGLAKGDTPQRIYIVEPTDVFENDPNVTNMKFPGNPTRSYRSSSPLKIVGEVSDWGKRTSEEIGEWKDKIKKNSGDIIN